MSGLPILHNSSCQQLAPSLDVFKELVGFLGRFKKKSLWKSPESQCLSLSQVDLQTGLKWYLYINPWVFCFWGPLSFLLLCRGSHYLFSFHWFVHFGSLFPSPAFFQSISQIAKMFFHSQDSVHLHKIKLRPSALLYPLVPCSAIWVIICYVLWWFC